MIRWFHSLPYTKYIYIYMQSYTIAAHNHLMKMQNTFPLYHRITDTGKYTIELIK